MPAMLALAVAVALFLLPHGHHPRHSHRSLAANARLILRWLRENDCPVAGLRPYLVMLLSLYGALSVFVPAVIVGLVHVLPSEHVPILVTGGLLCLAGSLLCLALMALTHANFNFSVGNSVSGGATPVVYLAPLFGAAAGVVFFAAAAFPSLFRTLHLA